MSEPLSKVFQLLIWSVLMMSTILKRIFGGGGVGGREFAFTTHARPKFNIFN